MFTLKKIIPGFLILVLLVAAYVLYGYYGTVDLGDRVVSIVIKQGDPFTEVATRLIDQGVVRSRRMLFYPARIRKIDRKLTPGRYDFSGENSCRSVLDKLERADFVRLRVTIYEGAPIWKVASILAKEMEADSASLISLNHDSVFLASVDLPYLEGYLFPQTYFFAWQTPLEEMVREMVAMYRSQVDTIWPENIHNNLSHREIIVFASIVEAEARVESEKATIASVYHNRIRKRMKLDADPTVLYGLGGLDRPLYSGDLRKDTPYNTYKRRGLPPTPINSPGLSAIRAALYPESSDYLFFVADGRGRHRFSRTNAEHNRARWEIKRASENNGGS